MTDCVRYSDDEYVNGKMWKITRGSHLKLLQNKTEDDCRAACISANGCKVWMYDVGKMECALSSETPTLVPAPSTAKVTSGVVKCAPQTNMLWVVLVSMIIAAILIAVYIFTKPKCSLATPSIIQNLTKKMTL